MVMLPLPSGFNATRALMIPWARPNGSHAQARPDSRQAERPIYERAAARLGALRAIMRWMASRFRSSPSCARPDLPEALRRAGADPHGDRHLAGVGLTVLVGTGLMGLLFVSNRSGHDDEAAAEAWMTTSDG